MTQDNTIAVDQGLSVLMVCLCDGPVSHERQFPTCACHEHKTVSLKALCEMGFGILLHFIDENGDIQPMKPDQMPRGWDER